MRRLLIAASLLIAGLTAQTASAIIIQGQWVPDELWENPDNRGVTEYRVFIVTDDPYTAARRNMTQDVGALLSFDNIIKTEADKAGSLVSGLTWEAIVSAPVTNGGAVTSAASRADGSGVAVYSTKDGVGEWLSADYAGLFAGTTLGAGSREYNQFGLTEGTALMWSGSENDGNVNTTRHLGQSDTTPGGWGISQTTFTDWLDADPTNGAISFAQSSQMRYYGISEVLTVPVPEPATYVMWLTFSGIAGLVFWRKRRKNS